MLATQFVRCAAVLCALFLVASKAGGQTNDAGERAAIQLRESVRAQCLAGRRQICGRIMQKLSDGLVIESGYTNLLREPLTRSWLVSGTVTASLATNLLESAEPGAVCMGSIVLTDLPKSRGRKPARYDYVIIEAYPAGHYSYTSPGRVTRTVRRFSANLNKAVAESCSERASWQGASSSAAK